MRVVYSTSYVSSRLLDEINKSVVLRFARTMQPLDSSCSHNSGIRNTHKARISSVLFVQNHVLLNSITKSFEKLHKISNKMFIVSHITCKHVQTMTPMINDFVICPMQRMALDRLFIYYFINLFINLSIYNLSIYYLPVCLSVHITPRPR